MTKATIIVLLKEGKDLLQPSTYRRLPTQSVFIPNRSTSLNIRQMFLNVQVSVDNMGTSAIFSLLTALSGIIFGR